jgi:signal transduction histidine kinase
MRGLVRETISLVRAQADEQDVQINVGDDDGIPANVMGDRERLKSCLSNITINAIQAMPTGGRLTAGVHKSDGMVRVTVADTGVGISQESISKIFEPYFSTKKSGFGLGLAVTKKIIEEHHGSIHVDSHAGEGTTFTVTLPSVADVSQPTLSN